MRWAIILCAVVCSWSLSADPVLRLYLDADMSNNRASGRAIEQGIRTALGERDYRLGDWRLELVIKDHRGSSPRSLGHLKAYLDDPQALALFAGMHSPPLLAHRDFINQNEILVLDPWAAAAPITRPPAGPNWIFRLSVDDAKAGTLISRAAVAEGFKRPYLLLEQTGWGRSNAENMERALQALGVEPLGIAWFNWGLDDFAARTLLREIQQAGADVIFLVGNSPESITFAKALLSLPPEQQLPLRSHWGLTGGDFAEQIDAEQRRGLDLKFLQTRFSFAQQLDQPKAAAVWAAAQQNFPDELKTTADLRAPAGFVHAYDLTQLLLAALESIELSGDPLADRRALHGALEQLEEPVEGLIKTYQGPFAPYSPDRPDAHEALTLEDLVMARYGTDNQILLEP